MIILFQRRWACAVVAGLLCTSCVVSGAPAAPQAGASRAVRAVPVGPKGTEVACAKQLVLRIGACKSLGELSPMLSNETAAYLGMMLGMTIGMVSAMAESFAKMAEEMAKQSGGQPPKQDPKQAAELQQMRKVASKMESIFSRYGLDGKTKVDPTKTGQLPASLLGKGRQLLSEVAVVFDSLPSKNGGPNIQFNKSNLPPHPDKLRFKVVSATRVLIQDPSKPKERIEALAEDGAWRLHVADIQQQLSSSMRSSGQGKVSAPAAARRP